MLYSRYGAGAKDILDLPYAEGMDVLYVAHKNKNEDRLYLRWCTSMSDKSFEDYKKQAGWDRIFNMTRRFEDKSQEKEQTEEEILASVKEILG